MDDWISFHLYYHEDLNRAVLGFVKPAITSLLRAGWIDRFFFVRYGLGGPHVRLRLRPASGHKLLVSRAVRGTAEQFLKSSPSTAQLDPELLRRQTEAMLASDSNETDSSVYPDNTLVSAPFRPETRRYGGPDLLPLSLAFFTASSAAALDFLQQSCEERRSRQLILALLLLFRQALGFAADEDELFSLLGYGVESWGNAVPAILAKGDRVFEAQREAFCQMIRREISGQPARADVPEEGGPVLHDAAQWLSLSIGRADREIRKRIGVSQLHMTATRLGLGNPEEAYISRLLSSAGRTLLAEDAEARSLLQDGFECAWQSERTIPSFTELLPRAFALLDESEDEEAT